MAANSELLQVGLSGWRTGLANLMHKENRAWWSTRRWLVQILVWTVLMNGVVALNLFLPGADETRFAVAIGQLFQMGVLAMPIGAILLAHAEIAGERQLGVTEWLLSKPVSRAAYVLSKLLAHSLGILAIMVGLQGVLAYGLVSVVMGEPFPPLPYLVGMIGATVHTLFYLALTVMMGVLTTSRGLLLGVSLGVHLGGTLAISLLARFLGNFVLLTPWSLLNALPAAAMGAPLPLPIWLPIGITAVLTAVCVAVALARFQRLEF